MSSPIATVDAAASLRKYFEAHARETADGNDFVSRRESPKLHPFLRRIETLLRAEGGPGTWVRVGALVERAMVEAMAAWDRVNPPDNERDHRWLAQAEIDALAKLEPELAELTQQAYDQVRAGKLTAAPPPKLAPEQLLAAARAWLESGSSLAEAKSLAANAGLPEAVRAVFEFHRRVQTAGKGTVALRQGQIAGVQVFVIDTRAGELGFCEVLQADGEPLAGARLFAGVIVAIDEFPGRLRLARLFTTLGGFAREEGRSEPDTRASRGQPPFGWAGELVIDQGRLERAGSSKVLGLVDFGTLSPSSSQRELAVAAFEHIWEIHLRNTVFGAEAVILGPKRRGTMPLGPFERSTDGKTYLVASWRDIDNGKFVLYYRHGVHGLELKSEQFDN